jgi:hypothetical protein
MAQRSRNRQGWGLGGLGVLVLTLVALSSCGGQDPALSQAPPPTVAPIFSTNAPTSASIATIVRPGATATPVRPDDDIVASRLGNDVRRVPIYDNGLARDWSLEQSTGLRYNLSSRLYVSSQPFGIESVPLHGAARLFFTVRRDALRAYDADEILGVSIMVSGGPDGIGHQDLLFTVMGSNAYTYWRENDTSVEAAGRITDQGTIFDEQRLYFLDFKNGIPADEWGEVVIWLDERILDPKYKYLTGIYILTDERYTEPFYIDEVNLLIPAN